MTQQHPTTAMSELSPAAQAVLDAYWKSPWDLPLQNEDRYAISAVLEAAADQVEQKWRGLGHEACQEIRAIAAELKAYA
jgi:hypothetical protein